MTIRCFDPTDHGRDWSSYRSRPPDTRQELESATHLILGHFTTSTFLDSILQHGLIPDSSKERAMDDNQPSDTESVYLTAMYDRFYQDRAVEHHGGEAIVVEVLVERASLVADECSLPLAFQTRPPEEALFLSLCCHAQSCKHRGPIPPE